MGAKENQSADSTNAGRSGGVQVTDGLTYADNVAPPMSQNQTQQSTMNQEPRRHTR